MSTLDEHPRPWRTAYGPGDDLAHVVDANGQIVDTSDPHDDMLDVLIAAVNAYQESPP